MADEAREHEHQGDDHGHTPGTHPGEHKPGAPGAAAPGDKKKNDRRTAILVILTAAGVLIAWMTLRKNPGSQATGAPAAPPSGSSATDPLNYPTSNGSVAGYGLGQTAGFDPNAYMGLQQQLDQLSNQISKLSAGAGASSTSGQPINIYENPPPGGWFPWSPHSGTNAIPHPLAGIAEQGTFKPGQAVADIARQFRIPASSIQTGPGRHWWSYARRGSAGPTAQGVKVGETRAQWAAQWHVPSASVILGPGGHAWSNAPRT